MKVQGLAKDARGASLWEYALLLAIGIGIFGAIFALRTRIGEAFTAARDGLQW